MSTAWTTGLILANDTMSPHFDVTSPITAALNFLCRLHELRRHKTVLYSIQTHPVVVGMHVYFASADLYIVLSSFPLKLHNGHSNLFHASPPRLPRPSRCGRLNPGPSAGYTHIMARFKLQMTFHWWPLSVESYQVHFVF